MPSIDEVRESAEQIAVTFSAGGTVEAYITSQEWNDAVSGTMVEGGSYIFSGLMPNTQYTIGLRTHCGNGLMSQWNTRTVTTAVTGCEPPDGFVTEEVSYTSALFDWNADGETMVWKINVWNTAFNQSYVVTEHPFRVAGLSQDVAYNARVRSVCGGMPGGWNDSIVGFSTLECQPVRNVGWRVVGYGDTAVTIELTWEGEAGSYDIDYGLEHFNDGSGVSLRGIQGTSYTIESLRYDTGYDFYVRSHCAEGVNSLCSERLNIEVGKEGVDVMDRELAMTLFPNPAAESVTVTVEGVDGEVELQVVDVNGRMVERQAVMCEGRCRKVFELGKLPRGICFVGVVSERGSASGSLF